MASEAGLGSRAERKAIADEISRYLDANGMARKELIRDHLSKSTIEKLFQGDFTERTLNKVQSILKTTFARAEATTVAARKDVAPRSVGGYAFDAVEFLQGDYLCIRPLFTNPTNINAYVTNISWSDRDKSLVFVERARSDAKYSQQGIVYVPFGTSFMNLVTLDVGSVRTVLLSLPDDDGLSRGIVSTLSNPKGNVHIPAASPIVLKKVRADAKPETGIISAEHRCYDEYLTLLSSVMAEEYGIFALPQQATDRRKAIAVVKS